MSTSIYIYGCMCGINANYVMKVKSKLSDVQVFNTKRNQQRLAEHVNYLKEAGMETNSYQNIVVENNGKIITLLSEWHD